MDDICDCLSGPSFVFLFPILQAALTGPSTIAGCECALEIVHRHTPMLAGYGADGIVQYLRKDMDACVLEVISHDRSQTFVRTIATEALVACFFMDNDAPNLGTKDLTPLLYERGALGGNTCRAASRVDLGSIGKVQQRLFKSNPLVKNRIWLNCFEKLENERAATRRAWRIFNGEAFLAELVASYLFEKAKANFRPPIYHGIYIDSGLVVFEGNKKASEIRDWLEEFQKTVNKAAGN